MLSVDDLRKEAEAGAIDTVVTAFTDMQGRLFGKRIQVEYFLDEVAEHGIEGCNYLLALDMEMDPVPGYEMANWEKGYGDFGIVPDLATLRRIPWLDRTALVLCDVVEHDGSPVVASPRQVLIAQYERAARDGLHADVRLRARVLPLQGELRRGAREGLPRPHADDPLHPRLPHPRDDDGRAVPGADPPRDARRRDPGRVLQGRGLVRPARGQHPLRRRGHLRRPPHDLQERGQGDRLPERDLGDLHGEALGEGHRQLLPHPLQPRRRRRRERLRRRRRGDRRLPPLPRRPAGAGSGSWRCSSPRRSTPTSATRPRAGRRPRSPGGATTAPAASGSSATGSRAGSSAGSPAPTSTPTSATRRCSPPGLDGIENGTDPGPELVGNAYEEAEAEPFPATLREAVDLWEGSEFARKAFGEAVWAHYLNYGRTEQRLFDEVVTDYERRRMFERG